MRYIVKCQTGGAGAVQVVAVDPAHAIEAARVMLDQGSRMIVVHDTHDNTEIGIAEFLLAHNAGGMVRHADPN
jgi:hypothetical protein